MPEISAEILLAQKLAGNTQEIRDKAYRRLKAYIETKSKLDKTGNGGFARVDLLKLWKGLHYSMWMQDKPLVQEQLSENITDLVPCFLNKQAALDFLITFYITECREWDRIDKWRIDKFSMLFRDMFNATLRYMKIHNWADEVVKPIMDFLSSYIIKDVDNKTAPSGLRYHLAHIYLDELQKVCDGDNSPTLSLAVLAPWVEALPIIKREQLRNTVMKDIFSEIILQSPPFRGGRAQKVRVDYAGLAEMLRLAAENDECRSNNRKPLHSLHKSFQAVAENKVPANRRNRIPEVEDITEDDIEAQALELAEFHQKLEAESRRERLDAKRKHELQRKEQDEAYESAGDSQSDQEESEPPPAKLAKLNGSSSAEFAKLKHQQAKASSLKAVKEKPSKGSRKKKGGSVVSDDEGNKKLKKKMNAEIHKIEQDLEDEEDSDAGLPGGPDMEDIPSDDDDFNVKAFLGVDDSDEEDDTADLEMDEGDVGLEDVGNDFVDAEEYEKLVGKLEPEEKSEDEPSSIKPPKKQTKRKREHETQLETILKSPKKLKVKKKRKTFQGSAETPELVEESGDDTHNLVPIPVKRSTKPTSSVVSETSEGKKVCKGKKLKKKSKPSDPAPPLPQTSISKTEKSTTSGENKVNASQSGKKRTTNMNNSHSSEVEPIKQNPEQKISKSKKAKKSTSKIPTSDSRAKNGIDVDHKPKLNTTTKIKKSPKAGKANDGGFDVEDFPEEAPASLDTENLLAAALPRLPSKKLKKILRNRSKSAGDIGVEKMAHFVKGGGQTPPKATVFRKSAKKFLKSAAISSVPSTPTSCKKRISFGGNCSVKKTAVKLRGSESHDPSRTPEQGILRVNHIEPGTVIQVGKQATIRNTLKNSKFPSNMMSSESFYL